MTTDWAAEWTRRRNEAQQKLADTKDLVMKVLESNGIKYVAIVYNGYGDSGQIDTIRVYGNDRETEPDPYDDKGAIEIPDVTVTLPETTGEKLKDFLDNWGWRLAYDTNPGFEINEGGQGTILIDVSEGKITIEHGANVTETHYTTHEI